MPTSLIEDAVEDIRAGKMVIIVDDEDRENEGDLAMAAEKITPDAINFMAMHGRGLICVPMLGERLEQLRLPMMTQDNTARLGTAFTVSVDVLKGATTGISAFDRAATIKALVDPATLPEDLGKPGHIFPLRYMEGGVLKRIGQTEGSVDLVKLAGLYPAAVICEVMADDGTMARMGSLEKFSERHGVKIVTVADIITYRREHEKLVERAGEARIPTDYGDFTAISYRSMVDPNEHIAMVKGDIQPDEPTLVRVHSECLTGDVLRSTRCDCGDQMALALQAIQEADRGVFVYMRQEGRGIGIHNKLKAYALQDQGMDTVEANIALGFAPDPRQYGVGAQILIDLGVKKMRLLTNNPQKRVGLQSFGLEIVEQVPIIAPVNDENRRYLETKRTRMGHMLEPAARDDIAEASN
ncbi:MAG: bifunctional 3,4-dihydroxy-2-butanone-4-phosphate synthase/GTP cyclohydrolase II [SAR202 cluster bacterium]|nr:bifunctional 3,4-dihydroxy-2-butanone-4-phosphate synthase/GTP cyclohydrolase II [SAR202 cluster bacterium]HAL48440.1 bifunctional 3,4-dihydroxy-2-butanone-4-phosphate synthase/GTP cyclohydrolase II [Dehalococcoidia bacterium]MDP6663627.1 bifunctional 3,4-dihydroxy-2-butanone-4-phosphate synthase/GTP cyclohydrolase II [SAR202 cluster bacterium]MDP6801353.1 bifunctional 3,4-dihydroxy-2-butanone-4-phosphate synthase/GTP cyclohydrolase II [SAR202 cluster bacterium]MQG59340.1 bifunctional 3,4-di